MKLTGIKTIEGTLELTSGLHIGAGDTEMRIGGTDNPVVKHPHTGLPYIPGSSLKGKIRALLEMKSGLMRLTDGKPVSSKLLQSSGLDDTQRQEALRILQLFGASGADGDEAADIGPTRASFADCPITADCEAFLLENNLPFTEVKSENAIDRIRGVAQNPRFTERVPAGVSFRFCITIKEMIVNDKADEGLLDLLLTGCRLLQLDALGGSGSRGYGRVRFTFADADIQKQFEAIKAI